MAKYLFEASYTAAGAAGLVTEGGSKRRDQVRRMLESLDGRLECFYYAFGDVDVYGIGELPDNVAATAMSLAINASGAVASKVVVLISPEDMDKAAKKIVAYRPPGG
jgi:uncharacterized protein with GYD domain